MPRPKISRRVCHYPKNRCFLPAEQGGREAVQLTVDEYEVIRLIDLEGLSQEQCGGQMGVARTTVQQIYAAARRKLARMLVEGCALEIGGGDFRLCDGRAVQCGDAGCFMQRFFENSETAKGETSMKIAVTYENGKIFQHFGHTEQFKIYEVEGDKVLSAQVVDTNGSGHGALAGLLETLDVQVLICGGIGGGAQAALAAAGIRLFGGVSGEADAAVAALISGNLAFNPDVRCSHHDHAHGDGHSCGDHGCGSHDHECGGHCGH